MTGDAEPLPQEVDEDDEETDESCIRCGCGTRRLCAQCEERVCWDCAEQHAEVCKTVAGLVIIGGGDA